MSFPRYPAYKDSGVEWLGEVPAQWDVLGIKRVCAVVGGSTPKSDQEAYWDGDIVWVTPADLSRLIGFEISDSLRTITSEGLASCGTTLVPQGSVVLSTRAPIGSLGIAAKELCTNQGCKALVPNDIGTRFLAYVLTASNEALNFRGKGTTFLELSGDELAAFKIPLPLSSEQAAIATFLDRETAKIDALVAEQERLIALLKEKRQAVISHAVTKGLDPSVPMMDSGVEWLGKVPAHWLIRPIKHVGRLKGGAGFPHSEQGVEGEELCFYKVGSLGQSSSTGYLNESENTISRETASALGAFIFPKETLVFAKVGAALFLARVRALPADACLDNNMMGLVVDETKHAPAFVRYAMTLVRFDLIANPGAVPSLNEGQIGNFALAFPPSKAEQEAIAAFLDRATGQLEDLFAQAETVISTLRERRSALISAAVTGQIDVRRAPEQAP